MEEMCSGEKRRKRTLQWLDIPSEIVELIAIRLLNNDITSFIQFGAVCKPWRSNCLRMLSRGTLPSQLPWLMLPRDKSRLLRFFSISTNKCCYFKEPQSPSCRKTIFCGSSQGWLWMVGGEIPTSILINPITKAKIHVPPFTELPCVLEPPEEGGFVLRWSSQVNKTICGESLSSIARRWVNKIVLSSHPANNDCVIMVMSCGFNRLAFCKPGQDTTWTPVQDQDRCYTDLTYWDGKFYAVDENGRILVCELGGPSPRLEIIKSPSPPEKEEFVDGTKLVYHLVESSGELLLVRRNQSLLHPHSLQTTTFLVFKIDRLSQQWFKVESLGNHTLFLSTKSSFSLIPSNHSGIKGNCIYFVCPADRDACGIYNVGNGTTEPLHGCSDDLDRMLHALWIAPSLC